MKLSMDIHANTFCGHLMFYLVLPSGLDFHLINTSVDEKISKGLKALFPRKQIWILISMNPYAFGDTIQFSSILLNSSLFI